MFLRPSAFSLITVLTLCACGGGGSSAASGQLIGAAGGIVRVDAGPLAGTVLAIPPGALMQPTRVQIVQAMATPLDGFTVGGPAVRFEPVGTKLALPATVVLPITPPGPVQLGGVSQGGLKVVTDDGTRGVREAKLRLAATEGASDVWLIDELTTCWFVRWSAGPFPIADFLPLGDMDFYDFDDDSSMVMEAVDPTRLPELPEPAVAVIRVVPAQNFRAVVGGRYWQPRPDGSIGSIGMWTAPGLFVGNRWIARESFELFPAEVATASGGATVSDSMFRFDDRLTTEPDGRPGRSRTVLFDRAPMVTPLGTFPDVLPVEITSDYDGAEVVDKFWLAWDVGIVRYEQMTIGFVGSGKLTGGLVGGQPLEER